MTLLLVLAGGAVGAPLRYLTDVLVRARHGGVFPWGTLGVNVAGSLVLGALASAVSNAGAPQWLLTVGGTGLCGALTTFSAFGFETYRFLEDRSWLQALLNVTLSIGLGLVAVTVGWVAVGAVG
jgi:fluoride exporter